MPYPDRDDILRFEAGFNNETAFKRVAWGTAMTLPSGSFSEHRLKELLNTRQYEDVLRLIADLRASQEVLSGTEEAVTLQIAEAECLVFTGRHAEGLELSQQSADVLRIHGGHSQYAWASLIAGIGHHYLGQLDHATENLYSALYSFKRDGDRGGMTRALNWIGNACFYRGDYRGAIVAYRNCESQAEESGLRRRAAIARINLSRPLCLSGDLVAADEVLTSNHDAIVCHGETLDVLRNDLFACFVRVQLRKFDAARCSLVELRQAAASRTHTRESSAWYEYMGELEFCCGNLPEAEEHLLHAIEIGEGVSRDESVIGQSRRLLAEVRLAQGDLEGAIAEGRRALEAICKVGEKFEEGVVYRIFAEAHVRGNEPAEARAAYKQSRDILSAIGAKFEMAKTSLSAGEADLFSRRERLAFLAEAERLFGEVGVEYWIDRTRAQLKTVLDDRGAELQARQATLADNRNGYFITKDSKTIELLQMAEKFAQKDIAILILGEPGVGKDHLARYLHSVSPRRDNPFVVIDLNTIPESLWESELFGYRKGTFTGATGEKVGLLESAAGGTVFLNEVGNLPLSLQPKLLEFLDTHQVRRLGELRPEPLDVRIVAATNENLNDAVTRKSFRADLFYRLAQTSLTIKPLRERRCDILALIRHFLVEFGVPVEDLRLLDRQLWVDRALCGQWTGNVRQLRSFVYQLVAIADRPADPEFPEWGLRLVEQVDVIRETPVNGLITRERLAEALERNNWNQRATARALGMSEAWIRRQISRFNIARVEDSAEATAASE